jgi:hypothetical protein
VRLVIIIGLAAILSAPAANAAISGTAPGLASQQNADLSAAKKKRKAKPAKKEEYLRAVPSTPPPGAKQ